MRRGTHGKRLFPGSDLHPDINAGELVVALRMVLLQEEEEVLLMLGQS